MDYPVTPDGRYMIIRGRLWRVANPHLPVQERKGWVSTLMTARREVKSAMAAGDRQRLAAARAEVHKAKVALGERGPVWWDDGAKDFNRFMAVNTPYKEWFESVVNAESSAAEYSHRIEE